MQPVQQEKTRTSYEANATYPSRFAKISLCAYAALYLIKKVFSTLIYTIISARNYCVQFTHATKFKNLTRHEKEEFHTAQVSDVQKQFSRMSVNSKHTVLQGKETSFLFRLRVGQPLKLDLRKFNQVISIDAEKKIAHVQGLISFADLLEETLQVGLVPKVVPELRGITIGGAISGLAIESSSFKEGLFHHSIVEMEVLTGKGEVVVCSPTMNSDLFFGMPNSYGTLGYILSAKLKLNEARPYVDVTYRHYANIEQFFTDLEINCSHPDAYDFLDGAIFSENRMTMVLGKYVDTPSHQRTDYVKDAIYYKALQDTKKKQESFLLRDYIWRWDRDSFWGTENTVLQNPGFRKFLGTYLLRSDRLHRLNRIKRDIEENAIHPILGKKEEQMIQDIAFPIKKCVEFYQWFKKEIGIHPLFICPVKPETVSTPLWNFPDKGVYCDIGFFDSIPTKYPDGYYNIKVEQKLIELNARKSLYSRSYYSEEEFKSLYYNGEDYARLKQKYDPHGRFATLYEKCVENR